MRIAPFRLERYLAEFEFRVEYLLCCSDCEAMAIGQLLALEPGATEKFHEHWIGYTESSGSPSLRREIGGIYSSISSEQVLVHTGAEEAIFLFMQAALNPGDHVMVHFPGYQSLFEVARSMGCKVSFWHGREENGWGLDIDELRTLIRPDTKVIVVNTPHNPTGFLMKPGDFSRLNRIAREHGIILFSDEVYRESEYSVEDRLPAACDIDETAVSLGVMSKTYGLAGLRIGWVATKNAGILSKMAALKDYTTICNSAPSEFLAELALRNRQALIDRNLGIIKGNLKVLDRFFSRYPDLFQWIKPKAGPIAFPRLIGEDVDKFCEALVESANVLLLPGTVFDDTGNHFRIGFGRKNLPEAIENLERFLPPRK